MKLMIPNSIENVFKCGEKRDNIIQGKSPQKEISCFKTQFEFHFNPDHTKPNIPIEITHIRIFIESLQSLSPNKNNAETTVE